MPRFVALLVLALVSLTTVAAAEDYARLAPPKKYDHAFTGTLFVRDVQFQFIHTVCPPKFGQAVLGCTFRRVTARSNTCVVFLVDYLKATPKKRSVVLRHEIAHCNGWRH